MNTIIMIDDIIVSSEILTEYFACDYETCGGVCCVIGDSGAPMEEGEAERIGENYSRFSPLMSDRGRKTIDEKGFFEIDMDGDIVTPLVPGSEECAYCNTDPDGHLFCAIERSWCKGAICSGGSGGFSKSSDAFDGSQDCDGTDSTECAVSSDFPKPISCRLYPIRVSKLSNGMTALNLHHWNICQCAFEKGRRERIPVFRFLRRPLTDTYGAEFYDALEQAYADLNHK